MSRGVSIHAVLKSGLAAIPPIPPNSPHFRVEEGFPLFIPTEGSEWDLFSLRNRHQRQTVAALARCAWVDEADPKFKEAYKTLVESSDARLNAELWREWGNQAANTSAQRAQELSK